MKSGVKCFEMWWPGTELNRRRQPFQGCALPPELPGHVSRPAAWACEDVRFNPILAGQTTGTTTIGSVWTLSIIATDGISLNALGASLLTSGIFAMKARKVAPRS